MATREKMSSQRVTFVDYFYTQLTLSQNRIICLVKDEKEEELIYTKFLASQSFLPLLYSNVKLSSERFISKESDMVREMVFYAGVAFITHNIGVLVAIYHPVWRYAARCLNAGIAVTESVNSIDPKIGSVIIDDIRGFQSYALGSVFWNGTVQRRTSDRLVDGGPFPYTVITREIVYQYMAGRFNEFCVGAASPHDLLVITQKGLVGKTYFVNNNPEMFHGMVLKQKIPFYDHIATHPIVRKEHLSKFALVMSSGSGKSTLANKYHFTDIDFCNLNRLPIKRLFHESMKTGNWTVHDNLWRSHVRRCFNITSHDTLPDVLLVHSVGDARAFGYKKEEIYVLAPERELLEKNIASRDAEWKKISTYNWGNLIAEEDVIYFSSYAELDTLIAQIIPSDYFYDARDDEILSSYVELFNNAVINDDLLHSAYPTAAVFALSSIMNGTPEMWLSKAENLIVFNYPCLEYAKFIRPGWRGFHYWRDICTFSDGHVVWRFENRYPVISEIGEFHITLENTKLFGFYYDEGRFVETNYMDFPTGKVKLLSSNKKFSGEFEIYAPFMITIKTNYVYFDYVFSSQVFEEQGYVLDSLSSLATRADKTCGSYSEITSFSYNDPHSLLFKMYVKRELEEFQLWEASQPYYVKTVSSILAKYWHLSTFDIFSFRTEVALKREGYTLSGTYVRRPDGYKHLVSGHLVNMLIASSFELVSIKELMKQYAFWMQLYSDSKSRKKVSKRLKQYQKLESDHALAEFHGNKVRLWHNVAEYEDSVYVYIMVCEQFGIPVNVHSVNLVLEFCSVFKNMVGVNDPCKVALDDGILPA